VSIVVIDAFVGFHIYMSINKLHGSRIKVIIVIYIYTHTHKIKEHLTSLTVPSYIAVTVLSMQSECIISCVHFIHCKSNVYTVLGNFNL
jgi:hypothetical protein